MKKIYRPTKLEIEETKNGGFKIVGYGDYYNITTITILEFNPKNSDLSIEMSREFAEFLIEYYNHNYS
jgi:hypothetical protein